MKFFYLLLGLSYLSPIFMQPWVSAFQDLCTIFALILLILLQIYSNNIEVDKKIIYIFGLIACIPLGQYLLGVVFFTQELALSLIYISVFFLSVISGTNFNKSFQAIEKLSVFFVFIGISCVLLQIIQWSGLYHSVVILDSNSRRPFANIGQPNNLATLLFIGFFSNILLFKNNKIKIYFYILTSITLMTGIVLTQSRTSWLVFFMILLLAFFKKQPGIFNTILRSSLLFLGLVLTLPYITLFFHNEGLTVTERVGSDSLRLYIWKQMVLATIDKPWFGYGWNQTSVAQTSVDLKHPINIWFEYSHNIFLDIMVWTGIPIGMLIISIIVIWFFQTYRKVKTLNQFIYFSIVTAFFIHCMLEFPFAYAYFLLPIGLYIGILHQEIYEVKKLKVNTLVTTIAILLAITVLTISRDYFVLNEKRSMYASENLFSQQAKPIPSKILVLDALDINNDILFLEACYVLKRNSIESIKNNFYRYPTRKNLAMYYKATLYYRKYSRDAEQYMIVNYPSFKENLEQYRKCS